MADSKYIKFVRSRPGRFVAKKTGLPQPTDLERFADRPHPVLPPVLVLGNSAGAQQIADLLVSWDGDVRRHADELETFGSIVVVADDIAAPGDIGPIIRELPAAFKKIAHSGRIVTVSRSAHAKDPAVNAARGGIEGFMRTLGKEARHGATVNAVVVDDGIDLSAPGVVGALRFFLSAKSAFVSGQSLRVSAKAGELPSVWERPLAGKVALVTGAARGIGESIARTLARDGARLVVLDVPGAGEQLTNLANELQAVPLQLDITSDSAGAEIVEALKARDLRLDIIVHNAGITRDKYFVNMTEEKWDLVVDVNVGAQIRLTRALLDSDRMAKGFRLVSLSSTSGVAGNAGQANYAYSKAAIMSMVGAFAPILAKKGGTANAVAPGFIETDMTAAIPPVQREIFRRSNSLKQGGLPLDVAETVAFLASGPAGGILGQTLRVCGQNLVGR